MKYPLTFLAMAGIVGVVTLILFFGSHLVGANDNAKALAKALTHQVKAVMYREATVHNPAGDTVPDWIDDVVLGRIREIF